MTNENTKVTVLILKDNIGDNRTASAGLFELGGFITLFSSFWTFISLFFCFKVYTLNPKVKCNFFLTFQWTVNGFLRVGFFALRHISAEEELSFDYQFQRYG